MTGIKFKSKEHEYFYYIMLDKSGSTDSYHRGFFYVMGIAPEMRNNINSLFNFKEDHIKPEGLNASWQTSGTKSACLLAFNLWNGYRKKGREEESTPYIKNMGLTRWYSGLSIPPTKTSRRYRTKRRY